MGLVIHVDGASRGNPGPAGAGVTIRTDDGQLIHEAGYYLGRQTNNAAEYLALLRALSRAQRRADQSLCVYSDSQLLVRQITGEYEVKSPSLARLYEQAQLLLLKVRTWSVRHIPREENRRADELANLAIRKACDVVLFDVDDPALVTPASALVPEPGEGEAQPPVDGNADPEAVPETGAGSRAVRVTLARGPSAGACPAGDWAGADFTVSSRLPAGLCVHAAHALLPTLLAMLSTDPQEFGAVPTLTVRCSRPGCGAIFHLSPVHSPNGQRAREES